MASKNKIQAYFEQQKKVQGAPNATKLKFVHKPNENYWASFNTSDGSIVVNTARPGFSGEKFNETLRESIDHELTHAARYRLKLDEAEGDSHGQGFQQTLAAKRNPIVKEARLKSPMRSARQRAARSKIAETQTKRPFEEVMRKLGSED